MDKQVYDMFMSTIKAVYDFLRQAQFMGISLLSLLITCSCVSILITGLINVVKRPTVETTTASRRREYRD